MLVNCDSLQGALYRDPSVSRNRDKIACSALYLTGFRGGAAYLDEHVGSPIAIQHLGYLHATVVSAELDCSVLVNEQPQAIRENDALRFPVPPFGHSPTFVSIFYSYVHRKILLVLKYCQGLQRYGTNCCKKDGSPAVMLQPFGLVLKVSYSPSTQPEGGPRDHTHPCPEHQGRRREDRYERQDVARVPARIQRLPGCGLRSAVLVHPQGRARAQGAVHQVAR